MTRAVWAMAALVLAGCAAPRDAAAPALPFAATSEQQIAAQIAQVADMLQAMGDGVDPTEAARAADIAVRAPLRWAEQWQVTDPPLVHNFKVLHGQREKGVCQDWANAMAAEIRAQRFRTLDLHLGIANARNWRLEHASAILSARGAPMRDGVVLDPWRIGQGRLYFGTVADDPRYDWEPLQDVVAWRDAWKARARGDDGGR